MRYSAAQNPLLHTYFRLCPISGYNFVAKFSLAHYTICLQFD